MKVRDVVSVCLPGEAMWAVIIAILDDGRIMARLDNVPISQLHSLRYGQVVTFEKRKHVWLVADQQETVGPRLVA